jgi:tRNA uridine 5-carboxymethylaminomethyl modification enzyme
LFHVKQALLPDATENLNQAMSGFDVIGLVAGTPAARRPPRLRASGRGRCCDARHATIGEMSCNPALAVWARVTWSGKSMLWTDLWAVSPTRPEFSSVAQPSQGTAVRGPRAQADRKLYRRPCRRRSARLKIFSIAEEAAEDLILDGALCAAS